jgi:ribonuclease III
VLGRAFADPGLLALALTHRSYCAENPDTGSNERLEFLGDAVLGLVVTADIYATYADLPEGQLAKLRASVVNTASLADVARRLGLGDGVRLGKGEEMSGGREKESILADALEAVIGAVFVDGGWEDAERFTLGILDEAIAAGATLPGREDFKTQLQELLARLELGAPSYRITGSGPDHDKRFTALAIVEGQAWGEGQGTSKKRAEQVAAESALEAIRAHYRETREDQEIRRSPAEEKGEVGA